MCRFSSDGRSSWVIGASVIVLYLLSWGLFIPNLSAESLIEEAKKEGKLTFYSTMIAPAYTMICTAARNSACSVT